MGSLETAALIPLGSVDIVGAGLVDSITNTVNALVILAGGISQS